VLNVIENEPLSTVYAGSGDTAYLVRYVESGSSIS